MKTQIKITLASLIANTSIPAELVRATVKQFGGWESFKELAEDVTNHGISGGFGGFIYHSETESFAKRNIDAISEMASSQAQEIGYDSTFAMIRGFNCLKGDKISDGELMGALCKGRNPKDGPNLLNALAWYAGEEVCRAYCDMMER